jgi:hypothetical protein
MENPFPLIIILIVAAVTALIIYQRTPQIAGEEEINEEGLSRTRLLFTFAFTASAVLFGVAVVVAYDFFASLWPSVAQPLVFLGGVVTAGIFSLAAAVVRPRKGLGGVPELIALNFLWGLGYGLVLPYTIR